MDWHPGRWPIPPIYGSSLVQRDHSQLAGRKPDPGHFNQPQLAQRRCFELKGGRWPKVDKKSKQEGSDKIASRKLKAEVLKIGQTRSIFIFVIFEIPTYLGYVPFGIFVFFKIKLSSRKSPTGHSARFLPYVW